MGQCLENAIGHDKMHPLLGPLTEAQHHGTRVFKCKVLLMGEEVYVEWVKNITKLKLTNDLRDYFYLPIA